MGKLVKILNKDFYPAEKDYTLEQNFKIGTYVVVAYPVSIACYILVF